MLLHEWTLVLFTLLAQTAIGMVLVGECTLCQTNDAAQRKPIRSQSAVAFVLFAAAGLISLGHLGSPLNSFYTITNIGSSWLSREIALLSLTGVAFLGLAFFRLKEEEAALEKILAILVVVLGLALVATMSRVYRLSVAPAWDSWYGCLVFFGSVFLMGSAWQAMVAGDNPKFGPTLIGFAFLGLLLAAAGSPLGVPTAGAGAINAATALLPSSCIASYLAWRIALSVAGAALLALRFSSGGGLAASITVPAFLLILAGELLGRAAFYISYARVGM